MHNNVRSILNITFLIFLTAAISLIANSDSESESAQEWLDRMDPHGHCLPKRKPLIDEFEQQPSPSKRICLRLVIQQPRKPKDIASKIEPLPQQQPRKPYKIFTNTTRRRLTRDTADSILREKQSKFLAANTECQEYYEANQSSFLESEDFLCPRCNKHYSKTRTKPSAVLTHLSTHFGNKDYYCLECIKYGDFYDNTQRTNVTSHVKNKHKDIGIPSTAVGRLSKYIPRSSGSHN